ncbi:P-loop containing nucleoside triphosphate hydrolase protein [Nemania abortiva]|nr:P-loop containing nucleoside triphosphate hydrolase protein [Nemania abortiva]
MATVSLDPEAIEQLSGEHKALLDTIDGLRKHGVEQFVDLPQIIVVGDQSSGKSSVLEAISRVRFPVKDGVCTRFATELVLRTDSQARIHVQVQPTTVSADVTYTFDETSFDKDDLPRITEEAKTRLLKNNASFSEDVLRIEICSPDVPQLTLVDLPGFYHSEDDDQSADGRDIVDRLVETYMARKNSIILAIVSARNQVVMQKVLSKVKAHDKNLERTLGIITKPDLLTSRSQDEDKFLKLAKNQEQKHQFALGWHILRNRSEAEIELSSEERDSKEHEFFESGVWSAIPSNNRGIDTLRKKLSKILLDHIRKNLGALIQDIEDKLRSRKGRLERLGAPRSSPPQLRAHLDKIASQFQLLSLRAIEGNYSDEFFGGLYPENPSNSMDDRVRKLRALVRDLNRTFAYVLATKGSRRIIVSDGENAANGHIEDGGHQKISLPPFLRVLEAQYPFKDPKRVSRDAIQAELEPLSSANQGTEFPGTTNDFLAVKLFQDQSRPWEEVSRFHIDLLLRIVKSFTEKLMAYITGPDEETYSAIMLHIFDPFFEKRTLKLNRKLRELLCHFQTGYPQPSDAEFRATLAKRRQKHLNPEILQNLVASHPEFFTDKGKRQFNGSVPERKSEFGVDSLIDKSETYYELSLRNFTDNVIILAVENCLVKELPTILTTSAVSQMKDDMLEKLAAESADIQTQRKELDIECEKLEKGLDLCKTYRGRNSTILPDIPLRPRNNSPTTPFTLKASNPVISLKQNLASVMSTSSDNAVAVPPTLSSSIIGDAINKSLASAGEAPSTAPGFAKYDSTAGSSVFGASTSVTNQNTTYSPSPFATLAVKTPQVSFGKPTGAFDGSIGTASNITSTPASGLFGNLTSNKPSTLGNTQSTSSSPFTTGSGLFGNLTSTTNKSSIFGNPTTPVPNNTTTPFASSTSASTTNTPGGATAASKQTNGTSNSIFGRCMYIPLKSECGILNPVYLLRIVGNSDASSSSVKIERYRQQEGPRSRIMEEFQHICATPGHTKFSPEELRLMKFPDQLK